MGPGLPVPLPAKHPGHSLSALVYEAGNVREGGGSPPSAWPTALGRTQVVRDPHRH